MSWYSKNSKVLILLLERVVFRLKERNLMLKSVTFSFQLAFWELTCFVLIVLFHKCFIVLELDETKCMLCQSFIIVLGFCFHGQYPWSSLFFCPLVERCCLVFKKKKKVTKT